MMLQQTGQYDPSVARMLEQASRVQSERLDDGSPLGAGLVDATKRIAHLRERMCEMTKRAASVRDRLVGGPATANTEKQPTPRMPGAIGDLRIQIDALGSDFDALHAALSGIL